MIGKLVILLLSGLFMSGANAAKTNSVKNDFCESVMEAAAATMRGHLAGVSPVEAIELADKTPNNIKVILREMIVRAYSSPRYSTNEYKLSAINEFAADYYIDCIKHST